MWQQLSLGLSSIVALLLLPTIPRSMANLPLWFGVLIGGTPFLVELTERVFRKQFGADLLAAMSVITATIMGQLIVASIIIVMLAGGQILEELATRKASKILDELAKRTPAIAHRLQKGKLYDISVADIAVGGTLTV